MAQGVASILTVVICMIFSRNEILLVYCYCAGMIYSAALRIYSAFRRTVYSVNSLLFKTVLI